MDCDFCPNSPTVKVVSDDLPLLFLCDSCTQEALDVGLIWDSDRILGLAVSNVTNNGDSHAKATPFWANSSATPVCP